MVSKLLIFCLFSAILIHSLQSHSVDTAVNSALRKQYSKSRDTENRKKLLKAYEEFETHVNDKITFIIKTLHQQNECESGGNEIGTCRKRPETESQILHEDKLTLDSLSERIENIHDILLALIPLATSSLETNVNSARVPHPLLWANLNDSVTLSCDSEGKSLSFCFWEHILKGQSQTEVILIDGDVIQNDGKTAVGGIFYKGGGLAGGDCGLEIQTFRVDSIGRWKCTLVARNGDIFTGQVDLEDENGQGIYFGTLWEGLKYFSLTSSIVSTIITNGIIGARCIAFDFKRRQIYWSVDYEVFRCNRNGTQVESVWKTDNEEYGKPLALAFDWITDSIYVASAGGFIWACNGRQNSPFTCAVVHEEDGRIQGLALDPVEGNMYWTTWSADNRSSVMMGGMDGETSDRLVMDLSNPYGIVINFASRRLYWADRDINSIQSSNLHGRDVRPLVQLRSDSKPLGVALHGDSIYWSTWGTAKLQSRTKKEGPIATHYVGNRSVYHLTVGQYLDLPKNRTNHCEGHNCAKVCVLTAKSSRCLE